MKSALKTQTLAFLLVFLTACSGSPPSRVSFGSKGGAEAKVGDPKDQPVDIGEGEAGTGEAGTTPSEPAKAIELKLALTDAGDSDAYDYTFGAAKITLESELKSAKVSIKKSIVTKKGSTLTAEQKALAVRLCKDIQLSESAKALEPIKEDSEELYLVWRSHFAPDVKTFLADYLAKEGEALACAVTITQEAAGKKAVANLLLHALSDQSTDLVGSQKMENALKEGLLLAANSKIESLEDKALVAIADEAKVAMKVAAMNSTDVKLDSAEAPGVETCYLVSAGGTTKPYNPKSKSGLNFNLSAKLEFTAGKAAAKAIAGRMIKECSAIKLEGKDAQIALSLTCADYFAVKDQGMEAGCAWDIPVSNKLDPENALNVGLALDKFNVKTRDGARVGEQTSESRLPISGINDIRDGKVNTNALSKGQTQLLEDALDVWIAIDEKTYRESFYNHIKTISWDGGCTYGAYAQYGSEEITWCGGGALTENYTPRRFQDPNLLFYRAMLAWHETRHTLNWKHDVEDRNYKPCEGTATSASLTVPLLKNCNFDYCKSMKPTGVDTYKMELNYDYNGDNTGRKGQGNCKAWSNELGVSGGGF